MSHIPSTFAPLNEGWTLTAVNPEAAPEALRATLAAGIPATVPGEATLDLLNAGLIDDPFDGDNENKQQWIGDVDWRFTCRFDWQDDAPTVTTWCLRPRHHRRHRIERPPGRLHPQLPPFLPLGCARSAQRRRQRTDRHLHIPRA